MDLPHLLRLRLSLRPARAVGQPTLSIRDQGSGIRDDDADDDDDDDDDVYDGLDASVTLLIHGLESDWIEEEMSDDDDFKWDLKL